MIFDLTDFCSHAQSVAFYVQSVSLIFGASPFYAVAADSWRDFQNGRVNYKNIVKMGIDCRRTARGKYYLQTRVSPQLSLGIFGIFYHPGRENIRVLN